MHMNKVVVSLFSIGMAVSPLTYATNGYFTHGYGMKAKGMAGVGIALPQDSLAAATNPAGMVMVGNRADLGLDLFKPSRGAEVANAGGLPNGAYDGNGKNYFAMPEFGYNRMMSSNMSLGVAVYGNGGMNTDYKSSPFGPNAGINLEQLFIAPTWAMKINSTNSIGVSLNLVRQTFAATGLGMFAGSTSNSAALTDTGTDTSTGVGLRLGWTGELTPDLTMGATYQPKTKMGKFGKYAGLFAEQGGFDIPANFGVGIAFKARPETIFAADYQVIKYGEVAAIANTLTAGGPLGANNGMGFGWTDVSVLKLGVSHALSDKLTVRAGYSHNTQPIPTSQTMFNILAPGVVQDHLTLGATWTLSDQNELTVGFMHAFEQKVDGPGAIPASFGGGDANLHMNQNSLGIAYGWKL